MASSPKTPSGSNSRNNKKRKKTEWDASDFPYQVDYNDHFETPLRAYQDVQPLIDWLALLQREDDKNNNSRDDCNDEICLYDPYYCNGRTAVLLHEQLGYQRVVHEKRDFYADIHANSVPAFDVLISNPPYSDTHKTRCLEFCFQQLRTRDRPFLLLMPAYTAAKQYYRNFLTAADDEVAYIIPDQEDYHYDHPENTGKHESPFASLWFCGLGRERVAALRRFWSKESSKQPLCRLAISLQELQSEKVVSLQNRPNPRQRRKLQKIMQRKQPPPPDGSQDAKIQRVDRANEGSSPPGADCQCHKRKKKNSKYRDHNGKRTKKRF